MEIIGERETQKKKKKKKTRWHRSYNETVRANWFCYAFKSGFL